jgi:site-specific DNA-methyltransferase (adenine-specific)
MMEAKRLLTPDGSLWVVIDPRWAPRFHCTLEDLGLYWQDTHIWRETFGVYRARKFGKDYRPVLWFTAHPKQYVFHPDRVPSARQTTYNDKRANSAGRVPSNVWTFPRVCESPCECLASFLAKLPPDLLGKIPPALLPPPSNVWTISRVCGTFDERLPEFPTQLPLELLRRIVKTASDPGDLVVDPFSGSATTGVACLELGRRYVGIEINPEYAQRSRERLLAAAEQLRSGKEQAALGGSDLEQTVTLGTVL